MSASHPALHPRLDLATHPWWSATLTGLILLRMEGLKGTTNLKEAGRIACLSEDILVRVLYEGCIFQSYIASQLIFKKNPAPLTQPLEKKLENLLKA